MYFPNTQGFAVVMVYDEKSLKNGKIVVISGSHFALPTDHLDSTLNTKNRNFLGSNLANSQNWNIFSFLFLIFISKNVYKRLKLLRTFRKIDFVKKKYCFPQKLEPIVRFFVFNVESR